MILSDRSRFSSFLPIPKKMKSFPPTDALFSLLSSQDWKKILAHFLTGAIILYILISKMIGYIYTHRNDIRSFILYIFNRAIGLINMMIEIGEYLYSLYQEEFHIHMEIIMDFQKWKNKDLISYLDLSNKRIKKMEMIKMIG